MRIDIKDNTAENAARTNIWCTILVSESGPPVRMSLNRVIGALESDDAANLKSSVNTVGRDLTCLCSTILLTLERNRKEFITAGSRAITPMISELPAIATDPYIAPSNNVPESPGNILLGFL